MAFVSVEAFVVFVAVVATAAVMVVVVAVMAAVTFVIVVAVVAATRPGLHVGFACTLRSVAYQILPNLANFPTTGNSTLSTEEIKSLPPAHVIFCRPRRQRR